MPLIDPLESRNPLPMLAPPSLKIAIVLRPKESFSAGRVGAIGTVVHRLATAIGDPSLPPLLSEAAGPPLQQAPFPDAPYHTTIPVCWPPFSDSLRYARGTTRLLRRLQPAMIEVHNRPRVALAIAAACHPTPVVLVLHNDPQAMSGARESTQRDELLCRFARIVCVSDYIRRQWMEGVRPSERAVPLAMINPVDFAELPAQPAIRENLILFVGRVVPEKGTATFVIACAAALAILSGWRAEDPDSPADFARAILGLAQNRERLDLVRYARHERVRRFDLPRTAARWDAMRRDILADRPC